MTARLLTSILIILLLNLTSCASIPEDSNPPPNNVIGAGVGAALSAGTAAVLGAPKPVIGLAAIGGASLGYYFSTLRFASKGIIKAGGKVYTVGDYVLIEVPTDNVFDTSSAELLPNTGPLLDSIVDILKRYPNHNIFISANTSGYDTHQNEQKLSENRASQIAAYLWANGITNGGNKFKNDNPLPGGRSLIYVGYGDALPIANNLHLEGIRANNRIQVVASPCEAALHWNKCKKCFKPFENIGKIDDEITAPPAEHPINYAEAFPDDHLPENTNLKAE